MCVEETGNSISCVLTFTSMSMRYTGEGAYFAGASRLAEVQHAQEAAQEDRDAGAPGSGTGAGGPGRGPQS